jgi:YVTN family beta-propeller protein
MAHPRICTAIALFFVATVVLTAFPVFAQRPNEIAGPPEQFVTFAVPGSASTEPATINNVGQIVGGYTDSEGVTHGFLLSLGVFTTIDFPEAVSTVAVGVNSYGQIVGYYKDMSELTHGFVLNNGSFVTIDDPAFLGKTFVIENTDSGVIVGNGIDNEGIYHGFILANGVFTTLNYPGANFTQILDINYDGSEIVGAYSLPSFPQNTSQGFTYINGAFTSVTFPKSASTALNGVNNGGELVGTYFFPDQANSQVFLLNGTTLTNEDVPGAVGTGAADLNDVGQIVGGYTTDGGATNAYLETNGPFVYAPVRSANSVAVFDVWTGLQLPSIQVGTGPIGLGLNPGGSVVYVANYEGNSVSAIDTASQTVFATIQVGNSPLGVAVTPNGAAVYVANNSSNTVSVINTDSNEVIATIPVGSIPSFVAITPNGNFVYVTNPGSGTVSVISTATNTVVASVTTGSDPVGLAMTPNGQFVYVALTVAESVAVINTASNTVVATIPVGGQPVRVSITPDGTVAYVSIQSSDVVQVINLATNTAISSVTVGTTPYGSAVTPDGTYDWVVDLESNQISIISTATNTVASTIPFTGGSDIAIAPAPAVNQEITQALSPTAPNTFNFGTNNFVVQYPPGTTFSGVNMTVEELEITQQAFDQRVVGTQFANATCIVYAGAGGNCVDYEVTCSNTAGNPIACPSESTPSIAVQTSFTTLQGIVNPGFLTTPIGENEWANIFTGFSDTTIKGRTKGFSEFVAVDLGASNAQGLGTLSFLAPLQPANPRVFGAGVTIPVAFQLASVTNPGQFITDAVANLTLEMVANAAGQSQSTVVLALTNPFHMVDGTYSYNLNTTGLAPGTYVLAVYGNAFAAQQVQLTVDIRSATTCIIQSSSPLFSTGEALIFTGIVQPTAAASVSPTGTITFYDSANSRFVLGTATLNSGGEASIKRVLKAPPDRQWLEFTYPGDNNFLPCTSQEVPEDYSNSK